MAKVTLSCGDVKLEWINESDAMTSFPTRTGPRFPQKKHQQFTNQDVTPKLMQEEADML